MILRIEFYYERTRSAFKPSDLPETIIPGMVNAWRVALSHGVEFGFASFLPFVTS